MKYAVLALLLCAGAVHAQDSGKYDDTFRKYSKRFFGPGFDWQYFKAQGLAESNLKPKARSRVGAKGVMQIMPRTFAELRKNNKDLGRLEDPEWNIAGGIMYDRDLWEAWDSVNADDERRRFMFGSYNAGPGNIRRASRLAAQSQLHPYTWSNIERVAPQVRTWRSRETLGYVHKIEDFHATLCNTPPQPALCTDGRH